MHDLTVLLDLGDAARDRQPSSCVALRRAVTSVDNPAVLLDAASQFADDEPTAEIFLRRCVALNRSIEAWQDLAALYTGTDPAARRWKTRAAIQRALRLDPSNLFVMRIRLSVIEQRSATAKVTRYASSIMRLDPNFFEPVRILARVLARAGRLDAAILELRRFKERITVTDARAAAWLIAHAEDTEEAVLVDAGTSAAQICRCRPTRSCQTLAEASIHAPEGSIIRRPSAGFDACPSRLLDADLRADVCAPDGEEEHRSAKGEKHDGKGKGQLDAFD